MKWMLGIFLMSLALTSCNKISELSSPSENKNQSDNKELNDLNADDQNPQVSEPIMVDGAFLHCHNTAEDGEEEGQIACSVIDDRATQITLDNVSSDQIQLVDIQGNDTGVKFEPLNSPDAHWLSEYIKVENIPNSRIYPIGIQGLATGIELIPIQDFPFTNTVLSVTYIAANNVNWYVSPLNRSCRALCVGRGGVNRGSMASLIGTCVKVLEDNGYLVQTADSTRYAGLGRGCWFTTSSGNVSAFVSDVGSSGILDIDYREPLQSRLCECNLAP